MKDLQTDIQSQLRELDSQLDLVALERPGFESLRLYIDHPNGVDLTLCEKVTRHLDHLLGEYSLEVSSPGPKHRRMNPVPETAGEPVSRSEQASISDSSRASEGEPKEIR
jgi:ribosome maturation factor RimP